MKLYNQVKLELSECIANNREDIIPEDGDAYFGLPKPYSVPTPGNCFHEMYYWDTYFTNVGLLQVGNIELAKNNVENIAYLIDRFGFMPNASRTRYLHHSQPPFFAQMVKEIYETSQDKTFLATAYASMKKEHAYFKNNRTFENGLSHYGFYATNPELLETRKNKWKLRTGLEPEADIHINVGNFIGYCESGWDCNPRWERHSFLYASPDLNSLLWNLESRLAEFAEILGTGESEDWQKAADQRKASMNAFLWNEERGFFADRQAETGTYGEIFSAAALYPLYFGIASEEQAKRTVENLPLLERKFGLVSCEEYKGEGTFQWGAPNLWPCIQWMAVGALERYGYHEDARRIAQKYVDLVETAEQKTGQLWEKYNADTGLIDVASEYDTPPMMGWTAGVYLKCKAFLNT